MSVDFDRSRVTLVDHPLVQHKLTIMRDENTGSKQFRELVKELALFEGYEATRDFPLEDAPVTTPICETTGKRIAGRKVAIVPILRAGLGMVDGLLELTDACGVSRRLDRELPAFIGRHGPVRTQTRLGRLHATARRV